MSEPAASGVSAGVDRLEFIVLVDNSIEWMTQLPPGWSTELKVQLQNGLPLDQETGVPILDLPNFCCGAHGLSILITTERGGQRRTMLFDTGPDGRALERNIAALKVPPQQIETIVLSHWHADHTGGLLTLLKALRASSAGVSSMPVVDAHASYPPARGILPPGATQVLVRLPADPKFDEIRDTGATLKTFDGPLGHTILNETVWVSGQIPREIAWDGGLIGSVRWHPEEKAWHPDELILDERYVAVDVLGLGLVIFSACSHAGICNVVADARKQFPDRPVHMVVGGLHLASPELADRIPPTTDYLKDTGVEFVVPLHCTGLRAKVALGNAFGQHCVAAGTGVRAVISWP